MRLGGEFGLQIHSGIRTPFRETKELVGGQQLVAPEGREEEDHRPDGDC